jgi:O-antigen/teichoic acid export membrane protein
LTLLGILFAPFIIVTMYGTVYVGAVHVFQILMGYFFLTLVNSIFVCSLIGAGKESEYTSALHAGSALLVAAIVIGTMLAGARGAAWGVVVGECCTMLVMLRATRSVIALPVKAMLIHPAIAAAGMAVCALSLSQLPVLMQAIPSLIVFGVLASVLKVVDAKEIQFLREKIV